MTRTHRSAGECRRGARTCNTSGQWGACVGRVEPAPETCNGRDDDCDGSIDEGLPRTTYYRDADGDTYGAASGSMSACAPVSGYVTRAGDCNDANALVRPNQTMFQTQPIAGAGPEVDFDYNCDGEETRQYGTTGPCIESNVGGSPVCLGGTGFWRNPVTGATADCGETGDYITSCSRRDGGCRATSEPRVVACR